MIKKQNCDPHKSAPISELPLSEILHTPQYGKEWAEVQSELHALSITDRAYGINPGDRRALYHLVRYLQPRSVLEIGTHIGASTACISLALRYSRAEHPNETFRVTTVDIADVNDTISKPWLRAGARYAPRELVSRLDCADMVTFVNDNSLDMLAKNQQTFDLIFLDGDHRASTNYLEINAALHALNPGGYILMHDYFPHLRPLWSDGVLITGPALATKRLQAEGVPISVMPLGELPWPTKLDSHVTSLAIMGLGSEQTMK